MRSLDEVSPGVFVATSRRDTTTSSILTGPGGVVLVDPAWEPDELDGLADLMATRGWRARAGIATHAHHDHLLWHPRFGAAPRYATARACELADEHRGELVAALGEDFPVDLADLVGQVTPIPELDGIDVVEHDGHAPGHAAVWLPGPRVLLSGDMLSDIELPLPLWPDDLPAYERGLDLLEPYVRRAAVLVPGHGHPTRDPVARLAADRRYLAEVRSRGDSDDPRIANKGMTEVHRQVTALMSAG